MLPVPSFDGVVNYISWAEDEDPYAIALSAISKTPSSGENLRQKLIVDNSIRKFIVDGLYQASTSLLPEASFVDSEALLTSSNGSPLPVAEGKSTYIVSAPPQITQMRERKSDIELQILKCVNEVRDNFHFKNQFTSPLSLNLLYLSHGYGTGTRVFFRNCPVCWVSVYFFFSIVLDLCQQ